MVIALAEFIPAIQINASQIARLDCLLAFANVAKENNYIRPVVEDSEVIDIRQGRHPVIEKQLPVGEKYIANDVFLDSETQQIIIITGPNMAGKSALLRQTARLPCWRRWVVLFLPKVRGSVWWIKYSPVWEPAIIFLWANLPLWLK